MQALLTDHVHRRFVGIADCPTTQELRRARRLVLEDNSVGALRSGRALLQQDSASPGRRAYAAAICRFSHWRLRDIDGVYSVELPRPPLVSSRRYLFPAIITRCIEAAIELEQLRLTTARRLALDALDIADSLCGPHARIAALPATLVAQVLYEQGYSSAAHTLIRDRFAAINSSGVLECPLRAYSVLAGIAMQAGKEAQALELLQDAELLGLERGWPRLVAAMRFERIRLLLRAERADEAQACAQRLDRFSPGTRLRRSSGELDAEYYRRRARVQLAASCFPTAAAVDDCRQLHQTTIESRDHYAALAVALQLAVCVNGLGQTRDADSLFLRSLEVGRVAGLYQVFIDSAKIIEPMLLRAYDQAQQPGAASRDLLPYMESVLAPLCGRRAGCQAERAALRTGSCLSSREFDILELVARGMSNKRIAQALSIAPETVKSHVKRIFIKLDVKTRAEAVSRANALGISPPSGGFSLPPTRLNIGGNSYRR